MTKERLGNLEADQQGAAVVERGDHGFGIDTISRVDSAGTDVAIEYSTNTAISKRYLRLLKLDTGRFHCGTCRIEGSRQHSAAISGTQIPVVEAIGILKSDLGEFDRELFLAAVQLDQHVALSHELTGSEVDRDDFAGGRRMQLGREDGA